MSIKPSTLQELNKALEKYNRALKTQIKAKEEYKEIEARLPKTLKYVLSIKDN